MKALVNIIDWMDEGKVIATNLIEGWFLFVSDYDGLTYYVNPDVVEFL